MHLDLPSELEQRLTQEARRQGVAAEECARRVLDKYLPPKDQRAEAVRLVQSWLDEGDGQEQQETGDYLVRALDEDRLSERKLFPPDLKGISW